MRLLKGNFDVPKVLVKVLKDGKSKGKFVLILLGHHWRWRTSVSLASIACWTLTSKVSRVWRPTLPTRLERLSKLCDVYIKEYIFILFIYNQNYHMWFDMIWCDSMWFDDVLRCVDLMCSYLESNSQTCLWTLSNCRIVELSNREESLAKSYFIEVLPEGGIATLEARLRSRGNNLLTPTLGFERCVICVTAKV